MKKKNEVQAFCMNCPQFFVWFWSERDNNDGTRTCSMLFRCYRIDGDGSYREYCFGYDINVNEEERSHLSSVVGEPFFVQVMSLKDESLLRKIDECAGKAVEPCYKVGDKKCKYCMERMLDGWNGTEN